MRSGSLRRLDDCYGFTHHDDPASPTPQHAQRTSSETAQFKTMAEGTRNDWMIIARHMVPLEPRHLLQNQNVPACMAAGAG